MVGEQLYWENVEEGMEIPSYTLDVTPTLIVDQVSGSQDYNLVHHDKEFAQSQGAPDSYLNTGFTEAMLCRLVTDWIGSDGWLKKLSYQMRRFNIAGDKLSIKGKVSKKYVADGDHCLECEVWIENQRDGVSAPGTAVVILPSKG